jgi:alpha-amylase
LVTFGPGYGYGNGRDNDILAFIDNHDNQRDANRHIVTYKDGDRYRLAVAFMLAWNYGYPRVMSSFAFTDHNQGAPTGAPTFNADQTCNTAASGWVCEHRWHEIRSMAAFRSACTGAAISNIVSDNHRIAFARDQRGYFAVTHLFDA